MAKIAPSVLSADFSKLGEEIKKLEEGGADYIHLDVMDGHYVPNITFGAPVIKKIRNITDVPFDVHLMIENPERHLKDFAEAGADIITIHAESTKHLHRTIQEIKLLGKKVGISLNPASSLDILEYIIDDIDLILIMSVNPGFGGQSFIANMMDKIRQVRKMIDDKNLDIILQVDGGIKLDNAKDVLEAGADLLVIGSDIFKHEDIIARTKEFKNIEL